ncbi:MAG: hypothetical protein HUJ98_11000 [Bacteroidaceae bacterium]|nr:hypothetical protein [Bacteroidaceae bacterium]
MEEKKTTPKKRMSKLGKWLASDAPPFIDLSLMTKAEFDSFNRHLASISGGFTISLQPKKQ